MPSRNIIRYDQDDRYYHVYARGGSKQAIFLDESDKEYFLYLFSRHLSIKPAMTKKGYGYPHYREQIELLCYCLMDNHFHLLIYQKDQGVLSNFMRSLMVGYTAYFNKRYGRSGPLFESRYKAVSVDQDSYLMHISRYIHLNPRSWKYYPFSSLIYYRKEGAPEWLQTKRVLEQHPSRKEYMAFVYDYEENKAMISDIKRDLGM